MDVILMGHWVAGHMRTMMSSVIYKSEFNMRDMVIRRVLIISCETFLRSHLRNTRRIALLGIGRGRVDGLGDEI